jgi:hypothetical protein
LVGKAAILEKTPPEEKVAITLRMMELKMERKRGLKVEGGYFKGNK